PPQRRRTATRRERARGGGAVGVFGAAVVDPLLDEGAVGGGDGGPAQRHALELGAVEGRLALECLDEVGACAAVLPLGRDDGQAVDPRLKEGGARQVPEAPGPAVRGLPVPGGGVEDLAHPV